MESFPYTELIEKLQSFLIDYQKNSTEDEELKYELQFICVKLDEISAILKMMAEFATILKIFGKLPS